MKGFKKFNLGKPQVVGAGTVPAEFAGSQKAFSRSRLVKSLVMMLVVAAVFASPIFAADTIPILDSMGTKVIKLLNAKWLKALLALALCIEFGVIAFGNAQGEGGMVKKVLPWVIGTAGILGATSIVGFFFKDVDENKMEQMLNGTGFILDTGKYAVSVFRSAVLSLPSLG